jgi:hypothetical protein
MNTLKSIRLCDYMLVKRGSATWETYNISVGKIVDITCRLCKEDAKGIHKLHCLRFLYDVLSVYQLTFCGEPSDCAAAWRYMLHTKMRSAETVIRGAKCVTHNNAALARIALNADPDLRECTYAEMLLSSTAHSGTPALVWLVGHLAAKHLWTLPDIYQWSIQIAAGIGHLANLQLLMHLQFEDLTGTPNFYVLGRDTAEFLDSAFVCRVRGVDMQARSR